MSFSRQIYGKIPFASQLKWCLLFANLGLVGSRNLGADPGTEKKSGNGSGYWMGFKGPGPDKLLDRKKERCFGTG